jgi:hypothetical protein
LESAKAAAKGNPDKAGSLIVITRADTEYRAAKKAYRDTVIAESETAGIINQPGSTEGDRATRAALLETLDRGGEHGTTVLPSYANLVRIFGGDPDYTGLGATVFGGDIYLSGTLLKEADHIPRAAIWLAEKWGIRSIRPGEIKDALFGAAGMRPFNPVSEYLLSLPEWDGKSRFPLMVDTVLRFSDSGQSDTMRQLALLYMQKMMIAAVRRALLPVNATQGYKHDHMLLLQGRQRIGKSSICRGLFAPWYADDRVEFPLTKDNLLNLHRLWGVELGEIEPSAHSQSSLKAALSQAEDSFRPPYGRLPERRVRRFVFTGSINPGRFLVDPTGAARFWVLPLGDRPLRYDMLPSLAPLLWSEAYRKAQNDGITTYLDDQSYDMHNQISNLFHIETGTDYRIEEWVKRQRQPFRAAQVLEGIGIPIQTIRPFNIESVLRIAQLQGCTLETTQRGTVIYPAGYGDKTNVINIGAAIK